MRSSFFASLALFSWVAVFLWVHVSSAVPQPDTYCLGPPCDFRTTPSSCDTVYCKSPLITATAPSGVSITSNLSDSMKVAFEHGLGRALAKTSAVLWATREIGSRLRTFVQKFAALNGTTYDEELISAFYGDASHPSGSAHNTGFVGPNVTALDRVLQDGNIREVWGAIYVLSHTKWMTAAILRLFADETHPPANATLDSLGLAAEVVYTRFELVRASNLLPGAAKYNGIPAFLSPPFNSWVRFDYNGPDESAASPIWQAARVTRAGGCQVVGLSSDDPAIDPPLSADELRYQCTNGTHVIPPPCSLQWYPGALCYTVQDVPFNTSGTVVQGYMARAKALGYRTVAGPSGTTQNMLQLALLLGFSPAELALVRLTMVAWMLVTDDHSLFEMMLGADPYMPEKGWRMQMDLTDFGSLMYADVVATSRTNRDTTFARRDVWKAVVHDWLLADAGKELFGSLGMVQQRYVMGLLEETQ